MLRFIMTDIFENKIEQYPLSCTINMEEDVPADSLFASFHFFECNELKSVEVYDKDELIFKGLVDEQLTRINENGDFIELSARNMASILLDNESVPVSYNNPSTAVIKKKHLSPFLMDTKEQTNDTYFGNLTVLKGESNYKALESFCKKVYKKIVRVEKTGEVSFNGIKKDKTVCFSNDNKGIAYQEFSENIKRCEDISKVKIKVVNSSGYHTVVENKDAVKRGIVRERYLNAVLTDTPVVFAQTMINKAKQKSYLISLKCKGQQLGVFGCDALVKDRKKGELSNLYVSSVRYSLNSKGETTAVTLKRKDV